MRLIRAHNVVCQLLFGGNFQPTLRIELYDKIEEDGQSIAGYHEPTDYGMVIALSNAPLNSLLVTLHHEWMHFNAYLRKLMSEFAHNEREAYNDGAIYASALRALAEDGIDQVPVGWSKINTSIVPEKKLLSSEHVSIGTKVVYAMATCGKTYAASLLCHKGAIALDFDFIVWGNVNYLMGERDENVSSWLKLRHDPNRQAMFRGINRLGMALARAVHADYYFTNIYDPQLQYDLIVLRVPKRASEIAIARAASKGKDQRSWMDSRQLQQVYESMLKEAKRRKIQHAILTDEYLSDYLGISGVLDDPESDAYIVAQKLLGIFISRMKEINFTHRSLRNYAHNAIAIDQCVIPVIGLSGMGAESILDSNGKYAFLKGDAMGFRSDPMFPDEWQYDPYYIWCKMLQLSERGELTLVSFTGNYLVTSLAIMPYRKVVFLKCPLDDLIRRKNSWRREHQLPELDAQQCASISVDYDNYCTGIERVANARPDASIRVIDCSKPVKECVDALLDYVRSVGNSSDN